VLHERVLPPSPGWLSGTSTSYVHAYTLEWLVVTC
jgi:hypothetical protein